MTRRELGLVTLVAALFLFGIWVHGAAPHSATAVTTDTTGSSNSTTTGGASNFTGGGTVSSLQRIELGENVYNGPQLSLPGVVGDDELILAHGDVLGDGTCHVMVFQPGQTVGGLANGTWKLVAFKGGTAQQRNDQISQVQESLGSCPLA